MLVQYEILQGCTEQHTAFVGQRKQGERSSATLVGLRRNERLREDAIALITAFDQKAIRIPEPRRMKRDGT